ncbi:MAG: hypothetical protein J7623_23210 [Chitinophaga sp.]|uniref:hypothetical protein n=1 Tax=Chitinophaga sp. TaxID=1869181 RepID=UPI001B2F2115|nr:hypothetical protein [Chitinophaga sp.]MBO9731569.1 hypothetical protein [Chitinophaga sp.]
MTTVFLRNIMFTGLTLLLLTFISCRKEAAIIPEKVPDFYQLPQGNQSYDDSIVAFHQKYNAYILYKFSTFDLTYNYTNYLQVKSGPANPAWIKYTLEYFKSECLNFYPESFLQKTMPFKILLAAYLDSFYRVGGTIGNVIDAGRTKTGFCATRGTLTIGWADSTLAAVLPTRRKELRGYMHRSYMEQSISAGGIQIPQEFKKLSPETYSNSLTARDGLIEVPQNVGAFQPTLLWDFVCYVNAITSHTKAELDATILKPSYDVSGLIQLKYAAVINFYRDKYGVDLQAIGEHP